MDQSLGLVGDGTFQRVAEGVAEVKQSSVAGFQFVGCNNGCFGAAGVCDCLFALWSAVEDALPVDFQPLEELGVVDQAVFGNFCISGAEITRAERVQNGCVSKDKCC